MRYLTKYPSRKEAIVSRLICKPVVTTLRLGVILACMLTVLGVSTAAATSVSASEVAALDGVKEIELANAKVSFLFPPPAAFERYEFLNEHEGEVTEKKKFELKSGTVRLAPWIVCNVSENNNTGEISGKSKIKGVILTLKGCSYTRGTIMCEIRSMGAPNAGEIVTKSLEGTLGEIPSGWFDFSSGLDLVPENGLNEFAKVNGTCLTSELTIKGDVIGEVESENKVVKELDVIFKAPCGFQEYKMIEEEGSDGTVDEPDFIEISGLRAALLSRDTFKFEQNIIIKVP